MEAYLAYHHRLAVVCSWRAGNGFSARCGCYGTRGTFHCSTCTNGTSSPAGGPTTRACTHCLRINVRATLPWHSGSNCWPTWHHANLYTIRPCKSVKKFDLLAVQHADSSISNADKRRSAAHHQEEGSTVPSEAAAEGRS